MDVAVAEVVGENVDDVGFLCGGAQWCKRPEHGRGEHLAERARAALKRAWSQSNADECRAQRKRASQQEVRRMVVKIALENPTWGYSRIVGALQNLGIRRSKTTIANILQAEGIKPTPERHHGRVR